MEMITAIRIRYRVEDSELVNQLVGRPGPDRSISLRLPLSLRAAEIRYCVEALNEHGAVLNRMGVCAGSTDEPFRIAVSPTAASSRREPEPAVAPATGYPGVRTSRFEAWGHASLWTGAGLFVLAGVATWQAKEAGDDYAAANGWDEDAADRSRTWAGIMYTGYILGAALVATGLWLLLDPPGEAPPDAGPWSVGVAPADHGVVLTFADSW
jgi:hypothetical protein